ncbi:MAG: bifunctional oligoribonuclease/PAP phosphatase NrnA [Thermodesulfovibrionales bacterium]
MSLNAIVDFLNKNNEFVIATHYNPDADTIGSSLALYLSLVRIGKRVRVLCKDKTPKDCQFLPFIGEIIDFPRYMSLNSKPDALIIVDCNHINRVTRDMSEQVLFNDTFKIVIDHHETFASYGDIVLIDPGIPSTSMIMYELIKALDVEIDKDIAECLYAGLCIDTGNFRHDNTNAQALLVASELVSKGVNPSRVYRFLFESWTIQKFRLFKATIQTLQEENGIAMLTVTRAMLESHGCDDEDSGNFVDFPKKSLSIKVSVLIKEIDKDRYRVSIRSKGNINVANVAMFYGGGGHRNAAGCTIEGDLDHIKKDLFQRIKVSISDVENPS